VTTQDCGMEISTDDHGKVNKILAETGLRPSFALLEAFLSRGRRETDAAASRQPSWSTKNIALRSTK